MSMRLIRKQNLTPSNGASLLDLTRVINQIVFQLINIIDCEKVRVVAYSYQFHQLLHSPASSSIHPGRRYRHNAFNPELLSRLTNKVDEV